MVDAALKGMSLRVLMPSAEGTDDGRSRRGGFRAHLFGCKLLSIWSERMLMEQLEYNLPFRSVLPIGSRAGAGKETAFQRALHF
jgi:hypothetical protein